MFVKTNARRQIVEATEQAQGADYIEIPGSVANNLPAGLLGFNGTVFTPNYTVMEGIVAARTEEDKARDPHSDAAQNTPTTEALHAAQIQALSDRNEFLEDCIAEMASVIYAE